MSDLSELGSLAIIERLKEKTIVGKDLPVNVRRDIVDILRHDKTQAQIAFVLGVSDRTVERDVKEIRETAAKDFGLSVDELAANLRRTATYLKKKAIGKLDYGLAWRIEREYIEAMQDLGYVHREPQKIKADIRHSIKDLEDNELDSRLRDLGISVTGSEGRSVGAESRKGFTPSN